jgi:ferredoxin--NADP+ reductase
MNEPIPNDEPLSANKKEIWSMVLDPNTHIFVAGLEKLSGPLFKAFAEMAGGEEHWKARRAELSAGGRYVELMY